MTGSLKSYTPALARLLGSTAAALYERQRALVRDGVLGIQEGRGPGSGVHLGGHSVALLLIAVLATDNLSETGEIAREIAGAKSIERGGACPLTKRPSFAEALAQILNTKRNSRCVEKIIVNRTDRSAIIEFTSEGKRRKSQFGVSKEDLGCLSVCAALSRAAIIKIADDLMAAFSEADRARARGEAQ